MVGAKVGVTSGRAKQEFNDELLRITMMVDIPYNFSAGTFGSIFFRELKDSRRIMGIKCNKCGEIFVPPRVLCPECLVELSIDDCIEVSSEGTVEGFTVVNFPFIDPNTGKVRNYPYGTGNIKLDGVSNLLWHFLKESDYSKIHNGMRVRAVFEDKRVGLPSDIRYFETIEGEGEK